jgi:hypothetical protein
MSDQVPPIQSERQNDSFVYFNSYVFRQQTRRKKVLDWMLTSNIRIQTPPNDDGQVQKSSNSGITNKMCLKLSSVWFCVFIIVITMNYISNMSWTLFNCEHVKFDKSLHKSKAEILNNWCHRALKLRNDKRIMLILKCRRPATSNN